MQEQNFEKQVQLKLDELSLTPSAPVWQKVEQEIRLKKKRRRMLAFWLFPLLLIGAATYWGLTSIDTPKQEQATAVGKPKPSSTSSDDVALSTSKVKTGISTDETTAGSTPSSTQKTTSTTITLNVHSNTENETSTKTPKGQPTNKFNLNTAIREKKANNSITKSNSYLKAKKTTSYTPTVDTKPTETNSFEETQTSEIATSQSTAVVQPGNKDSTNTIETGKEPTLAKSTDEKVALDSLPPTKKKQEQTPKWLWSVKAGYGISSLQTALLSKSHDMPQLASGPIGNSGFPTTPTQQPLTAAEPNLEKGNAFHLGVAIKHNVNKRLAATVALQYHYFSTKNTVGQTVEKDTMVYTYNANRAVINQYYRTTPNGQTKKYTNNYHFLELPIGLEWQVLKNTPLKLETGISLSYLVASNALVYDPNASIYYHNNELLNRTQLHLFGGLSYQVWKNKKLGLHVGPYFQYGVTGLQKETSRYHLLSTGIKTQVSF